MNLPRSLLAVTNESRRRELGAALVLLIAGGCFAGASEPMAITEQEITNAPGMDVSQFQGSINWSQVKAGGKQFSFIRASYTDTFGVSHADPSFAANWQGARAAGVIRGAYHYFQGLYDGVTQANFLINQINAAGGMQTGDLPPAIDVEHNGANNVWDPVTANNVTRMQQWLITAQNAFGVKPYIYTNQSTWAFLGNPQQFSSYPLWVANFDQPSPAMPAGGWATWTFWQYHVQSAPITGMPGANGLDLDFYTGSCDNGIPVGGTACATQGGAAQYRCLFGSTPGASLWAAESCNGGTCSGSSCTTGGGGSCSCSGGGTFWHTSVPASDTSCGFRVCGGDNQLYACQADGWHGAGGSPCNCRCTNGADSQGRAINPDYTYCGYSVCGSDHQHYSCTATGWSPQHDTCS